IRIVRRQAVQQRARQTPPGADSGHPGAVWPAGKRRADRAGAELQHRARRREHLGVELPVVPRRDDLRRLERDSEEHHRRTRAEAAARATCRSRRVCWKRSLSAMDFDFTQEQVMLRNLTREFLTRESTPRAVRTLME